MVDDEHALVVEFYTGCIRCFVLERSRKTCLTQHRTSYPVPSLSSDSDVGDLPVDPVASSRDPSVFRACQVVLFVGHAHRYAILLVRIAWVLAG